MKSTEKVFSIIFNESHVACKIYIIFLFFLFLCAVQIRSFFADNINVNMLFFTCATTMTNFFRVLLKIPFYLLSFMILSHWFVTFFSSFIHTWCDNRHKYTTGLILTFSSSSNPVNMFDNHTYIDSFIFIHNIHKRFSYMKTKKEDEHVCMRKFLSHTFIERRGGDTMLESHFLFELLSLSSS